ncbi:MAG: N-6 DNA methylase [Clostridia bacterium]|nr:N-6 DNA methylase [Clostridia bacterium]
MNTHSYINNLMNYISKKYTYDMDLLGQFIEFQGWMDSVQVDFEDFDRYIEDEVRVLTGSYYTPKSLAKSMVRMSFYDYFVQNKFLSEEYCRILFLEDQVLENFSEVSEILSSMKIADISCGSGVFLHTSFELIEKWNKIHDIKVNATSIINQLYGYDINEDTLKVCKLWFIEQLLKSNEPVENIHLFHMDTLLMDEHLKFDLIVGNPPYVGEKGNKALFDKYRHLKGYEGKMDLFYFFIYKGMKLLKTDGLLTFITTNYWITADGASKLRAYIKEETSFKRLVNLDEIKLFSEAKGMHNLIFSLSRKKEGLCSIQVLSNQKVVTLEDLTDVSYHMDHLKLFSESNNILLYENQSYYQIIEKVIQATPFRLFNFAQINQGIVSGADKVTQKMLDTKLSKENIGKHQIHKEDGIFVLNYELSEKSKPFYKNSDIKKYTIQSNTIRYILYITDDTTLNTDETNHLLPFKPVLDERREVKNGKRKWYALQWYRDPDIFEGEKIVVPQRAMSNTFAYTDQPFYASADVYFITKGPLKLLTGYLNSKFVYFWLYNRGKRKGQYLELYASPLSLIPVPLFDEKQTLLIEEASEKMIKNGYCSMERDLIDKIIYQAFNFNKEDILHIEMLYKKRGINANMDQTNL